MDHKGEKRNGTGWPTWLPVLAVAAAAALLAAPPHAVLDKMDVAAYAVCHRIPERTFTVAGRPLPLCARCSGLYLGAAAGLGVLVLRGRGRAGLFPKRPLLAVLALFFVAWAVDGVNSFLTLLPAAPYLYEPRNALRLITGTLQGLGVAALLLPVASQSFWARPSALPSVGGGRDLAWLLAAGAAVVGLVSSGWAPLLYPLALLSGLAVVGLLGTINAMALLMLLRREGRGVRWRDVIAPLAVGISLAFGEIAGAAALRGALAARWGVLF